jgi:hypothetical protein
MDDDVVIETWSNTPTSIRELIVYYLRAVERFREQDSRARDSEDQLHSESLGSAALAEALSWADTVDQYLAMGPESTKGTQHDRGWVARLPDEQADVVRAFGRIRNVVHHQWWRAVGTRITRIGDRQVNEWFWAPLPDRAARTKRDRDGDRAYGERLEGRAVLATLDELGVVFWSKRTWQISRSDVVQPGHGVGADLRFDDDP